MTVAPRPRDRDAGLTRPFAFLALLAGLLELAALAAWQRNGYWSVSDGAYAETARELLDGVGLYTGVAAAQPPPVYLIGALVLWIHDGVGALRAALAAVDLATAWLVGLCVWRLAGRRGVALAAGLAAPLVPISLHEHAALTPETLAAPLLMLAALWSARPERAVRAGVAGAAAIACKLAFVLPAGLIVLAAVTRRRAVAGLLGGAALLAVLSGLVFGGGLWRGAVRAQLEVGRASLSYAGGLITQGLWNELGLLIGAAAALLLARCTRDPALLRTVAAAALGAVVLLGSLLKHGSYVNVLAVADPPLVALAACGGLWAWERVGSRAVVVAAAALVAVQSTSLLLSPDHAVLARRPLARSGLQRALAPALVDRAVRAARRCPPGVAYSGDAYIAFLADRRMPGAQPDLFITANAPVDAGFARRAEADRPRCP